MDWDQQWRPALTAATDAFAELVAGSDLTAVVPGCPGWTLADLTVHVGGIHQWAAHAVRHGTPDGEPTAAPAEPDALAGWYRASAAELIDVLAAAGPDAPAWTFGPRPRTAGFWRRRQVHETQMHLYDARASQGRATDLDPAFATDGIDEVTSVFFPRQVRLTRTPPVDGTLRLAAGDQTFAITGDGVSGPGRPRATVSGPAGALLLLLWKRIGPDDPRLRVDGDAEWAKSVLSQALTP